MPTLYHFAQAALAVGAVFWIYSFGYWRGLNRGIAANSEHAWERGHEAGTRQCIGLLARHPNLHVRAVAHDVRACMDSRPPPPLPPH